jgi:8-oxo-dGTP diphosphatase
VEAGESPEEALRREVAEELGCSVAVEAWLEGEQPIGTRHVLRAARCRLEEGEPRPGEDHDQLRWLAPDELDDVEWLEPDRPFLPALRAALLGSSA